MYTQESSVVSEQDVATMSKEELATATRRLAKRKLNKARLDELSIKEDATTTLGDETVATLPEDLEFMFASKLVIRYLEQCVAVENIQFGYVKSYLEKHPDLSEEEKKAYEKSLKAKLKPIIDLYTGGFDDFKKYVTKLTEAHPLWQRLKGIKGFTAYQLGIMMALIKDIRKFDNPSNLMIYAGVASVDGVSVCKKNIAVINEIYHKKFGKEFKGFNTVLSGRLHVIGECLMRSEGYFNQMYNRIKERLMERVINNNEYFVPSETDAKNSKKKKKDGEEKQDGGMTAGRKYMLGKKNQSVEAFCHSNAMRRIKRTLLYLIWKEWRDLLGLDTRTPYPIEYLGHTGIITLQEVLEADKVKVARPRKVKKEVTE